MNRYLITTLAEYQTAFWLTVGLQLRSLGESVAFLSFDDRSTEMLKAAELTVFSSTGDGGLPADDGALDAVFTRFGIERLNFWMTHERFAFGRTDTAGMRRKLARSLLAADKACTEWQPDAKRTVMVQELGGFLSVVGSFFAARHNGIDNWFIEPSFFRGRMFFLRNSFAAMSIDHADDNPVPPEVTSYLDETIRQGAIVVPLKDRHQYTTARKKIVNWRNASRLIQKLVDKHVHGKNQEFGHIGHHVRTHSRMLLNSHRLRNRYTQLERCGRYVYYPLHVPGDMALTLRSPQMLEQFALIDYLCRCVPATHKVVIKEHPAMVGAMSAERLIELLDRYDNLVLLPPSTNNYKVLGGADAVVSVNSKSGAEAGLVGKPVMVLGDAFYRGAPFATPLDRLQDLASRLSQLLSPAHAPIAPATVREYFGSVWRHTHPGELYVNDPQNVEIFTRSMIVATT